MKIYSDFIDVRMVYNFVIPCRQEFFGKIIFIHSLLTKAVLHTVAHATPFIATTQTWTALQKNKEIHHYDVISSNVAVASHFSLVIDDAEDSGICWRDL